MIEQEAKQWLLESLPHEGIQMFIRMVKDLRDRGTVTATLTDNGLVAGSGVNLWIGGEFYGTFWKSRFVTYPDRAFNPAKVASPKEAKIYLQANWNTTTTGTKHDWPCAYYEDNPVVIPEERTP